MKMIIGGACQGKRDYAKTRFPQIHWLDGADCTWDEIYDAEGIDHFAHYLYRRMKEDNDLHGFAAELIHRNPALILITDEVGCGVVPMEPFERAYRETAGRICTELAAYAEEVYRVVCGIGTMLKG